MENRSEIEFTFIWLESTPRQIDFMGWKKKKKNLNESENQGGREYLKGWDQVTYK